MTIDKAIELANKEQHRVGTTEGGVLIEAIIAAPTNDPYFTTFIDILKDLLLHTEIWKIDFHDVAKLVESNDYSVFELYEGTLHDDEISRSGEIRFGKLY